MKRLRSSPLHNPLLGHVIPLALVLLVATISGASASALQTVRSESAPAATTEWTFSGRVYEGYPYDYDTPLYRVLVSVYGSNVSCPPAGSYGQFIRSTYTDGNGWWSLTVYDDDGNWEYYHLVENDPQDYVSVDATTVGGAKCSNHCVEYAAPPSGTMTGNMFWDVPETASTDTPTATATSTWTATATETVTPSVSPSVTPSATTESATATPSDTRPTDETPTATASATISPTPRVSETPSRGRVTFPEGDWPWYAQEELSIHPEPPVVGNLARICATVINTDKSDLPARLEFRVGGLGIGVPFQTVGYADVVVPGNGEATGCVIWTPATPGHWCLEVVIWQDGEDPQYSRRNMDVDEPLTPGMSDARTFPVGNPLDHTATITLGLVPHLPDWELELSEDVLIDMEPGEIREVTLIVTPPEDAALPPDGTLIVDVEAYAEGELIGGIRKVFRPAVPLHVSDDPVYAESEITVNPYPPRAGEPTELCVELRNISDGEQTVGVQFSWAAFGIGIPFTPINGVRAVTLPAHSTVVECLHWVPPVGGHLCIQVELTAPGYEPQISQRNMDVEEPLSPGIPHTRVFSVGNPLSEPVTITLGLVPHLANWGLELSEDVLPDMAPGDIREVGLTVTPPEGEALPPDGQPIVDVEAYADGELIGGFRKIYRPPVPVHKPKDPVYAESEIGIDPYPAIAGEPVKLSVELFNPTDTDQIVPVIFSVAPFGIGIAFEETDILPNPISLYVPAHGAASGHVTYTPPEGMTKFCVQVTLEMEGHEPIYSRRNVDVGEPLRPLVGHALTFPVGSWPYDEQVTIVLGTIVHKAGWEATVSPDVIPDIKPGEIVEATLIVTPPLGAILGTGDAIVDVEAFVDGTLLGGFRKLDVPPVPVHKASEKRYAESELEVIPYPPQAGEETVLQATLQNTSDDDATVDVVFGWANFGMGIPFSSEGMDPITQTVAIAASNSVVVSTTWTPAGSGHQCVMVRVNDVSGAYMEQVSQRNVDIAEEPPCDVTKEFTFTIANDSPFTTTVDIGMITFNVPEDWEITVDPSGSVEIEPGGELTVTVTVVIPCAETSAARLAQEQRRRLQSISGSEPTIYVEGYTDGELVGGIEIRFASTSEERTLILPLVMKWG